MNPEVYDRDKFAFFLVNHGLNMLKGKQIVLFLGASGHGKSTGIAVQLGSIFRYVPKTENKKAHYSLVRSGGRTPVTSDGIESQTLNIKCWDQPECRWTFVDTAGLFENRGANELLWTSFCNRILYTAVDSFKAIVVTVNYNLLNDTRVEGLAKFASEIANMTAGSAVLYQSMVFLVTNVVTRDGEPTISEVNNNIRRIVHSITRQKDDCILNLARKYPPPRISRSNALFDEAAAAADNHPDWMKLSSLNEQLTLLNQMTSTLDDGSSRIVLSDPDGEAKCSAIKRNLEAKIRLVPTVTKDALNELRQQTQSDNSLTVQLVTSLLAGDFLGDLTILAESLTELLHLCSDERMNELLTAINNSWETTRDDLVRQKESARAPLRRKMEENEREINRLKLSAELIPFDEHQVLRAATTKFFYVEWIFGKLTASGSYSYRGSSFERVQYTSNIKGAGFSTENEKMNKADGTLDVNFVSDNGKDLNVTVVVTGYEKNHPATIQNIAIMTEQNAILSNDLRELENTIQTFRAVSTKQQLLDAVTAEQNARKAQVKPLVNKFQAAKSDPYQKGHKYTPFQTIAGLRQFFSLMGSMNGWNKGLSRVARKTVNQFNEAVERIDTAFNNVLLVELLQIPVSSIRASPADDDFVPPKNFTRSLQEAGEVISNFAKNTPFLDLVSNHRLELSGSCLVYGLMLWVNMLTYSSSCSNTSYSTPVLFVVIGTFLLLSWIRTGSLAMANTMSVVMNKQMGDLSKHTFAVLNGAIDELGVTRDQANIIAGKLVDRVKFEVDAKVNINDINIGSLCSIGLLKFFNMFRGR